MTSFFHDLEEQLRTAAHERTSGAPGDAARPGPRPRPHPRRGLRWLAGGARAVPVVASVAVAVVVLVGALVLLGHRGGQSPTPPASGGPDTALAALVLNTPKAQLRHEVALIGSATRKVQASAACRVARPRTAPQIHAAPGQALLSTLGVLRRPATPADRLPAGLGSAMYPGVSFYAGAARRAARIRGATYYLVPIRQDPAGGVPSTRCFALQSAALAKALPTFPRALRSPVRRLQAALIAYDTRLAAQRPTDAVCVVTAQRNGGGMGCSDTAGQIRNGLFPEDDNGVLSGLVPDGVASVRLSLPGRSAVAIVHSNFYATNVGVSRPLKPGSITVTWRAADGRIIRSYAEPPMSSVKQVCRQHPDACISAVALAGGSARSSASSSSASATVQSAPSPRPKTSGG
jgi:hypothetical protein